MTKLRRIIEKYILKLFNRSFCVFCGKITKEKCRFIDDYNDIVGYEEFCCQNCKNKVSKHYEEYKE